MSFVMLDLSLLVIFLAFASFFLWKNKKNLKSEGSLLLYRTKLGMKVIDNLGNKHKKLIKKLGYVSIVVGWILMILMIFLIIQTVYLYLTTAISTQIKAPPVMPLIPYFPQLFGLQSMFPPFYFIYFIIALLIVATVHEFSHGVFAKVVGIKIKSTGFAFFKYFPALFGAFVEQDEKQMIKKNKKEQMSVLSAGVFANILTMILFVLIMFGFFHLAFQPAGVSFNGYSYYETINVSSILAVNGINLTNANYSDIIKFSDRNFNRLETKNKIYFATQVMLEQQIQNKGQIVAYHDAPSIRANLPNIIKSINGIKIRNIEELGIELDKYKPNQTIIITATDMSNKQSEKEYEVALGENPNNNSVSYLGIWFTGTPDSSTIRGKIYSVITLFKEPGVYYEEKIPEVSTFVYNLFWWIIIINLLVALFNMLPLGILDGGRFFYLGIWSLTKSEKVAKVAFMIATYFLLGILAILMAKWLVGFF